ncbi:hypothetical protein ACRWUQ_03205 [Escherichia coli]
MIDSNAKLRSIQMPFCTLSLWNITPPGLPRVSYAISSAFMVSLLSGENDMAQPTGFL